MRAVIIGGGKNGNAVFYRSLILDNDYIICADGGYDLAMEMGIEPDILIGDLDSVKSENINTEIIKYPTRKDATDGEIAVDYAIEKGYDDILMIGFIGNRMDHTMTNISLLIRIKRAGRNGVIIDYNNEIRLIEDSITVSGKKGDLISIIPITDTVGKVVTEKLEYTLDGEDLYYGESRGVSNVMLADECTISIKSGRALVIKSRD